MTENTKALSRRIRRIILDQAKRAHVGHIGPALSVADLIAVLFDGVVRGAGTDAPDRDRFVLSKGHAGLALYAALHCKGVLSREQLDTYCQDGSLLGTHPEHALPGIDFSTGSLGHGLSFGVGAALAARMDGSGRRAFVLVSDAECNEGSLWEAAMFAAHHRLSALTVVVDRNGQQALGRTAEVLNLDPLVEKWRSFGWRAADVDGHDLEALKAGLRTALPDAPSVLVAKTVAGRGVSFMEGQVRWHYMPMTDEEYARACAEIEGGA